MITLQRWVSVTALVVAVGLLPQLSQAATPKLSLGEDATVRISVGSNNGVAQVMMRAENLTEDVVAGAKDSGLKDLGGVGTTDTTVDFEKPVAVDVSTTSRAWLWTARIKNLPTNSSQKRSARLAFGKIEQYIEYTVTNLPPAAFTWSVAVPGIPWLVWFGYPGTQRATTVVITTGDSPASNLRLAQSSLRDGLGTSQIALEDLELCESVTGPCGHFNVNARSNRTLYVLMKEKAGQGIWQSGKYTGALSFAVNERPELQNVNVTLQASSFGAKGAGAVLVLIGILLAWLTSVWARARLLRLEALRPVTLLKESITNLMDEIKGAKKIHGVDLKLTTANLISIKDSLEINKLDSLLPPKVPRVIGGGVDTSTNLKEYLNNKSQLVDCLTVVICDGMRKLWNAWEDRRDPKVESEIKNALNALDAVGGNVGTVVTTRSDAIQKVNTVLQAYQAATTSGGIKLAPPPTQVPETTMLQVSWQIARISWLMWLVWGILTFIVGVAVLIVTNPGFGTSLDLIFCLLWGFGLPIGIDKLQQTGPGGIAATIGIPWQTKTNP
jgi:hypothetical protein